MNPRVTDSTYGSGRLRKALEFAQAASIFFDDTDSSAELRDAYVTLAIHSGIASSDVICAKRLGEYSAGDSHHAAIAMLKRAEPHAALSLSRLLDLKTKAGYGHNSVSARDVKMAHSSHLSLLEIAQKPSP